MKSGFTWFRRKVLSDKSQKMVIRVKGRKSVHSGETDGAEWIKKLKKWTDRGLYKKWQQKNFNKIVVQGVAGKRRVNLKRN